MHAGLHRGKQPALQHCNVGLLAEGATGQSHLLDRRGQVDKGWSTAKGCGQQTQSGCHSSDRSAAMAATPRAAQPVITQPSVLFTPTAIIEQVCHTLDLGNEELGVENKGRTASNQP